MPNWVDGMDLSIETRRWATVSISLSGRWSAAGRLLIRMWQTLTLDFPFSQVRAGTDSNNNGLNNPVVGTFPGPGWTGGQHYIEFTHAVTATYINIQLNGKDYLQVNGVHVFLQESQGMWGFIQPFMEGILGQCADDVFRIYSRVQ